MRNLILMSLVAASLGICSISQGSLVSHYKFEDNLTNSAADTDHAAGRGAALTYIDGPTGFGKAVRLNGTDNYINAGYQNAVVGSQMTVAAWIYDEIPAATNHFSGIVCRMGFNGDWALRRYSLNMAEYPNLSDKFQLTVSGNNTVAATASTNVGSGQWVHIAATFDSGVVKYYVNGVLAGGYTDAAHTTITSNVEAVIIGRDADRGDLFKGGIDDVRLYNNALTDAEVASLTVPEPATMALLTLGGLGVLARRKK